MHEGTKTEKQSRGGELFIVQLVFLLLAGICTLVRAYVKTVLVKRLAWDDYLIFLAMVGPLHLILIRKYCFLKLLC